MKNKALILSLGRTGSLPVYAESIASNFKETEYEILLSKNRREKKKIRNAIEMNTYNDRISFLLRTLFYFPFKFISLIPNMYEKYKVLYLPYSHFWDLPFILLFRLLNRKVVLTVHDGILHTGERNFFTQSLNNYRIKSASHLIFLSKYVQQNVFQTLKINKPYKIIPHPVLKNDHIVFSSADRSSKNLLFFGRIDRYKGVELLMESVVEIADDFDRLIIAGKSQYSVKYITHPKIEIIDCYLSEKQIGEIFNRADILVLPYLEATQSGVIALGIYAEKPMICTRVGGFQEQLAQDECFWCDANKVSLQQTIKKAFESHDIRHIKQKMKEKKQQLSWEIIAESVQCFLR